MTVFARRASDLQFQRAAELARQGQLAQAESACRQLLSAQPRHADGWRLKGVLHLQQGQGAAAVEAFRAAVAIEPNAAIGHALLGEALLAVPSPAAALASYERALALDATLPPALFGRGNALLDLGRALEALGSFEAALAADTAQPEVWFNRGNACLALARQHEAIESYDRALALRPRYAAALNNRGAAWMALHRPQEALASFEAALAFEPDFAGALCGRGATLAALHRPHEALASFERALATSPEHVDSLIGCADLKLELKRPAEALTLMTRAVALAPGSGRARLSEGNCLLALGRFEEALRSYDEALRLDPAQRDAYFARGCLYLRGGALPAAAAADFAKLLELDPGYQLAPGYLRTAQQWAADWSLRSAAATPEALIAGVLEGRNVDAPFAFLAVSDSARAQRQCARTYVQRHFPHGQRWPYPSYRHAPLRIAYVSPDFRDHAVAYLMAGVLERHDRARFEILGVSLRTPEASARGERMRQAVDRLIDVSALADADAVELLRSMQVDVAVDLAGLTEGMRPGIFAGRVAPVQVSLLGFPGTMGADFIDYLIADDFVIPEAQRAEYSEQVAYLPDCFQANDDRREIDARPLGRGDVGLPETAFVFCCFNTTYKIGAPMFDIWMRLLAAVPGSVLWLLGQEPLVQDNLRREAAQRGIDPARLMFAVRVPYAVHLRRLTLADLALDTFPFGGGTSTSDALWAGLPWLTCAGEAFASRMAGSLVRAAGLPELLTLDLASYEQRALELAQSPERLGPLRRRLAATRDRLPLFDTPRYCRHLEAAFEHMVRRQRSGAAPESFRVAALEHAAHDEQ